MTDNPTWERLDSDTDKSYEAFCIYRDMGAQRSLEKVSQELTKSVQLIKRWSTSHDWVNRTNAYDDHQRDLKRQRIEQKRIEIEFDALSDYDAIRKAIAKRIEILEDSNYIAKPHELHELIDLMQHANAYARLNSGMPDKISRSTNTNNTKHSGTLNINTRELPPLPDDTLDNIFDDSDESA